MAASCSVLGCLRMTMLSLFALVISLPHIYAMLHCKNRSLTKEFLNFALRYKRGYLSNETEFERRCEVFQANLARAEIMNRPHGSTVYGVNKFADMSPQEFQDLYLSSYNSTKEHEKGYNGSPLLFSPRVLLPVEGLPQKVDWREKKVLTPVKDQKSCGACWAFSVVETIESMFAIQNKTTLPLLSVQELIDCNERNKGCEGGDICSATLWAKKNGVVPESVYPLTDHTDQCKRVPASAPRVKVDSYTCSGYIGNEKAMLSLLATQGPIAVAISASSWHNYVGGIIKFHCSSPINHAVEIVGYDLTGEVPYYIVRNSWGSDFGDNGYLYIKYGDNMCGLAAEVSSFQVL